MRHGWLLAALAVASWCWAQDKPLSLVLNGGFEKPGGWSISGPSQRPPSARGGVCLEINGMTQASQDIPAENLRGAFTVAADARGEGITPPAGQAGYAYLAVYQLGDRGEIIAFHDFGQIFETQDWQRYEYTFTIAPGVVTISLRCGIHNAAGKAWFDNWVLVPGERAYTMDEVAQMVFGGRPAEGAVAVFREPGLPVAGAASDPERLGGLLERAGLRVTYLSAADLADARKLRPDLYHLLVLPYGQSFPAAARQSCLQYLHQGGSFISTGGYAFSKLLLPENGQWRDEAELMAKQLQEALESSVLPDSGFEQTTEPPVGGTVLDGQWRRDGDQVTIVTTAPKAGKACAQVHVPPGAQGEHRLYLDVPPDKGASYRVSGWVRTQEVVGGGFAYLALYEYDGDGTLRKWQDFAVVRGTTDWQQFTYDFTPGVNTTRLHIKMGLYQATGTAWFDDIRLSRVDKYKQQVMNTSTGSPGDGLGVAQWQIGAFDASFPLRRVARVQAGEGQYLFDAGGSLQAQLAGWAAAGVQGSDNARWVELLAGRDRFGRQRGPVGALMMHYNGYFAGSLWAFFGAENRDLFDGRSQWLDEGFVRTAQFIVRGLFLRNLKTDLALYRDGEAVKPSVTVQNYGTDAVACTVAFEILAAPVGQASPRRVWAERREVTVPPGDSLPVEVTWQPQRFGADLYQVRALLLRDGQPYDEMTTGFVVERPQVVKRGPTLRFRDNYLTLNDQPIFLFGSDTYANVYRSSCENPWTWHLDHVAARDYGFNLYENLQFSNPDYVFTEADWRQFLAMAQSTQREGLVFMPGYLIGHNVAIGEELLQKQAAQCAAYAEHFRNVPGLLHYINGDFFLNYDDKTALRKLWNDWLAAKYGSAEALRASWGDEVYGEWGAMDYPAPSPADWNSVRSCDVARFEVDITRKWVQRHVDAIHSQDADHPITSEYYLQPFGGLDIRLTIDGMDVANIGYFREPEADIQGLPLHLRLNDLRSRGKSLSLGEYGVKTHPAWSRANGATAYHIVRTEEQQKELFMAVAHYGLAMGASKVQNWCLRDASENVFPWGVFYPNGRVPKDVAYWHRNMSLVWRFFRPRYEAPPVTLLMPDNLRLGARGHLGISAAMAAIEALIGLQTEFNVLDEHHMESLSADTKVLIWPVPFCPDDAAYEKVHEWVRAGGRLLVTGDLSLNWDRRRTRTERLRELCGVEFVRELEPPATRSSQGLEAVELGGKRLELKPCIEVKAAGATVEAQTAGGIPLVTRHKLGRGEVVYCTDPLELGAPLIAAPLLPWLYAYAGGPEMSRAEPGATRPDRVTQSLTGGGRVVVTCDRTTRPRDGIRYPQLEVTDASGRLVALGAAEWRDPNGARLLAGDAHVLCLSLDGAALTDSRAVLIAPLSAGRMDLRTGDLQDPVVLLGDLQNGRWVTLETRAGRPDLTLDEDTMTCLLLACERAEQGKWIALLNQALNRPWEIRGY